MGSRGLPLARALVELADTLADDFDAIEHLHVLSTRYLEFLDADAVVVQLGDREGMLRPATSSAKEATRGARLVQAFGCSGDEGPGRQVVETGAAVACANLRGAVAHWPGFAPAAVSAGFVAVHCYPLRSRTQVLGVVSVFRRRPVPLDALQATAGSALADAATVGLLQQRRYREKCVLAAQLQTALDSRVIIEQAKGILAERHGEHVDRAFDEMRSFARANRRRLSDVAAAVVAGGQDVADLTGPSVRQGRRLSKAGRTPRTPGNPVVAGAGSDRRSPSPPRAVATSE